MLTVKTFFGYSILRFIIDQKMFDKKIINNVR